MYQITRSMLIRLSDHATIPLQTGNRDYEEYLEWVGLGNTAAPITQLELSLSDVKLRKLGEINQAADNALLPVTRLYPKIEVDSWSQQEHEAVLILADISNPAPLLNALAYARGIDLLLLAEKVIAKSYEYSVLAGQVIGARQKLEDRLEACMTSIEVDAIEVLDEVAEY